MQPPIEPVTETQTVGTSRIAGFWRRLLALGVDGFVLGTIGFPLGLALGERFAPVGTPARLIGLLIIVPYLGVLGSVVGNGRTVGKRLLGLRVVDANGRPLSLARSFARAVLLSLPWIFNGIRFGSLGPVVLATLWVAGILVFGLGGAIVGTYVLNRRTRQALHDLLVGSYVIRAEGLGLSVPGVSTRTPMIASMAWIGLVVAGTTAMLVKGPSLMANQFPSALLESASAIPGANSFQINHLTVSGGGRTSNRIVAVLWYRGPSEDTKRAANELAAALLQLEPDAASAETLDVTIIRGWDVGVANLTTGEHYVHTPAQWRAELGL